MIMIGSSKCRFWWHFFQSLALIITKKKNLNNFDVHLIVWNKISVVKVTHFIIMGLKYRICLGKRN